MTLFPRAVKAAEPSFKPPAFTEETPGFDFSADHYEYDKSSHTMVFQGNGEVWRGDWRMASPLINLDVDAGVFSSTLPFTVQNDWGTAEGRSGSIDPDTGNGAITDGRIAQAPWFFEGRSIAIKDGRYRLKKALFTTCEYRPPDYYVAASRTTVYPDHWMSSWNNVVYVGRVPVFYVPYWYQSMAKNPSSRTTVSVSDDKRNGGTIRSDTQVRLSSSIYDHVFVDGYSKQGVGVGNELDYNKPDAYRGTVYVYDIHEIKSDRDRWTATSDDWQKLSELYSMQWRLQTMSDPAFNNDYYRSNNTPVTPYETNSVALVRQTSFAQARLSYQRQDNLNPANPNSFVKGSEDYPRFDFQTTSFKAPDLPWLNQITAFADHNYAQNQGYIQNSAGVTYNATQKINLTRDITFNPSAGLSETYQKYDNYASSAGAASFLHQDVFLGRYFTTEDLRDRTILGDWDAAYSYARRLAPGTFNVDAEAPDRGVEKNQVSLEDFIHPVSKAGLKVSTAYNLAQANVGSPPLRFIDRLQPISANLYVNPTPKINIVSNAVYQDGGGLQNVTAQADYGRAGDNHFGMGMSKSHSNQALTQLSNDFGLWPKWGGVSLEGNVHYQSGLGVIKLTSLDAHLRKSWHDFEGQLGILGRRGSVLEFQAYFSLRFRQANAQPIAHPGWEEEWYPWRNPLVAH